MTICLVSRDMYIVLVAVRLLELKVIPSVSVGAWRPVVDILVNDHRSSATRKERCLLLCNFSIRFCLDTKPLPSQLAALYMSFIELNMRNLREWRRDHSFSIGNAMEVQYVVSSWVRSMRIFNPWISCLKHWRASIARLSSINSKYFCSRIKYFIC